MKMIEITKDKFDDFAKENMYGNYCQTFNYALFMAELKFDYSFLAYTTNEYEILACGMFITKKIGSYYYAYCPKGFLIDYNDTELLKKFIKNLVKYYKRKKIFFLKINPEIPIGIIDQNKEYERITNENLELLNTLKTLGFKKRKEINPLELLQPKLNAIINLKEYSSNKLDNNIKKIIEDTETSGLKINIEDATKIDDLYEICKNNKKGNINFYRNFYNSFKKTNSADIILVKVDYENFLISSKKRAENEQIKNDELNKQLQQNNTDTTLTEKMESDKRLEKYKMDVIYATNGLKKGEDVYVAGTIVIRYNKKINIILPGINEKYSYLNPRYYMYHKILEMYKDKYDIADIGEIANDFTPNSKFTNMNKFLLSFNPTITEYIGELDLIISQWKFKIIEKNNLLSNEFKNKKI